MNLSSHSEKILITAFDFPPQTGGVATYALELAQNLSLKGYDVHVVTKKRPGLNKSYNFTVHEVKLPNSGLLSVPILSLRLNSIIKQVLPQRILCTLWMPGGAASFIALKAMTTKIPYQIIVHGMEIVDSHETLKKRLRASLVFLKKMVFNHAEKVICISQYTKNKVLEQKLCSANKVQIVHNGVNPQKFQLVEKSTQSPYPQLLTVARLVPHKGIDQLLYALPPVIREHPSLVYYVVGDGPDKNRLEDIAAELSIEKHVRFLGKISDDELSPLYSQADLFVLLSREDKHNVEGFGLVFLEAAACQTPSLGGRSGGIPDAIIEEQTGWLVHPTEQQEIVTTLLKILKHPDDLKKMGQSAYKYTLDHRTWDKVTQQILNPEGVS